MKNNSLKTPSHFLGLILISLLFLFNLSICPPDTLRAESSSQPNSLDSGDCSPLIVYYSRSGNSQIVADTLKEHLSCSIEGIQSTKNREGFLGVFTCVLDQLFNRDDTSEPLTRNPKDHNPIILVAPVWIGKLASPARTFIKQGELEGKDLYLALTYNGSLTEEKETILTEEITSQGVIVKGIYKIITKEKTEDEIKKEVLDQLEKKPLLTKVPMKRS